MRRALATCLLLALCAGGARAEAWGSVFATGRDTAVFLASDGTLFRAPFHLATRDVLWPSRRDQHVVRFAASPAGGRIAWIVRGFDEDSTRLWLAGPDGVEQRLRYFALLPRTHRETFFEPDVPTTSDHGARGGRLVRAVPSMLRSSVNTLDWTADGRSVLLGNDGGLVSLVPGSREGWLLPGRLALGLEVLRPSGLFLVDGMTVGDSAQGRPATAWDLAYMLGNTLIVREGLVVEPPQHDQWLFAPVLGGWRPCERGDWAAADVRVAGRATLWWARGKVLRALGQATCVVTRELEAPERIVWLGFDVGHGDLLGASGSLLWRRAEAGGPFTGVLDAGAPIRAVLASRTTASVAVVTRDSLLVWSPGSGAVRRFASNGLAPCALFEAPDGSLVVQVERGTGPPLQLARADAARGRLAAIATPQDRWARTVVPVCRGTWLVCCGAGSRPPRRLHAYDVSANRWHVVENPGIAAWEPMP